MVLLFVYSFYVFFFVFCFLYYILCISVWVSDFVPSVFLVYFVFFTHMMRSDGVSINVCAKIINGFNYHVITGACLYRRDFVIYTSLISKIIDVQPICIGNQACYIFIPDTSGPIIYLPTPSSRHKPETNYLYYNVLSHLFFCCWYNDLHEWNKA